MAQISLSQKCNFSYCLRCGYNPKTGQNQMIQDAGSRSFTFGYGSGEGLDWSVSQLPEFSCQLCDAGQSYFLNPTDGTCTRVDTSGPYGTCQQKDINGNCLLCPNTAYYNPLIASCVDLLRPQPNCVIQRQDGSCQKCAPQFYYDTTAQICAPVYIPDTNCLDYQSAIVCRLCAQNFVVDPVTNRCQAIQAVGQCYKYNMLQCNNCKAGFGFDQNNSRMFNFDLTNELQLPVNLIQLLIDVKLGYMQNQNTVQCFSGQIPNCTIYTSGQICQTCAAGYYLSSTGRSCMAFPTYLSTYCLTFGIVSGALACTACKTGYKLNSGTCAIFDEYKLGCNYYSTSNANDCTHCSVGYYLVSGACVRRTQSILYCAQYVTDADECSSCIAGYWYKTSNTYKGCLPVIPYCQLGNHVVTNPGTAFQIISCTQCVTNYLLTQDQLGCGPVTTPIQNCFSYNKYNYCDTCQNQFLISTQCTKNHSKIANCQNFSQIDQNECRTCRPFSFKRTIQSYCYNPKVAVISNCTSYSFILQRCLTCDIRYRLADDGNSCIALPTNCLTWDSTNKKCSACDSGYGLALQYNQTTEAMTWSCIAPIAYKTANCSVKSYVTNNVTNYPATMNKYFYGQECDYCLNQTLPAKGKYQCFSTNDQGYLQDYSLKFTPVDKCVKYSLYVASTATATVIKRAQKLTDFSWHCQACDTGYWIHHNDTDDTLYSPRTCQQNLATNNSNLICWYGMFDTAADDIFYYRSNFCRYYSANTEPVKAVNSYAYLAPNVNAAQTTTFMTLDTTANTYYNNINHDSSTVYTINDCITSTVANTNYYKVFTDLSITDVSNISTSSTNISTITHPLYTNIGFSKCMTAIATGTVVDNCKFYADDGTSKQYCVACKDNALGLYSNTDAGDNLKQMASCTANYDSNYNAATAYQNIKAVFGKFLSIKKCNTAGQIPIIQVLGGTTSKFDFTTDKTLKFYQGFNNGSGTYLTLQSNYCMAGFTKYNVIQSLSLAVTYSQIASLPANCAYGILNNAFNATTFDNSQGAAAKQALSCLQCKPGYKPTYVANGNVDASLQSTIVSACTLIQFCNLSTNNIYLDACGQCAEGFAYEYNYTETGAAVANITASNVKYDTCVWAGSLKSNCYAVSGSGFYYGLEKNASLVQTTVSKCVMCKRGYSMSFDRKSCVQESVSQCSSSNYIKTSLQDMANNTVVTGETNTPTFRVRDLRYLTYYFQGGALGCNSCSSGYASIYKKVTVGVFNYPYVTTKLNATQTDENVYIWANSNLDATTQVCAAQVRNQVNYDNGIPNCQNYYDASGTLKCKACVSGYVVKNDYTLCYPSDQLANCLESSDEKTCTKCILGNYILLDGTTHLGIAGLPGQCVPHPIPNCETYGQQSVALGTAFTYNSASVQYFNAQCTKCVPGFFRNAFGQCSPGPVPKCKYYDVVTDVTTQPSCNTCVTGFQLFRVPVNANNNTPVDTAYTCVPINTTVGCSAKIANYGYSFVANQNEVTHNCRVCDSVFTQVVALNQSQIVDTSLLKTDCLMNLKVPNCAVYKSSYADDPTLRTTLQQCTKCLPTHYLKATINTINQCVKRKFFDPQCQVFNDTADLCVTCNPGRYLSTDGTRCIQYPVQNQYCTKYNDKQCIQCSDATTHVYLSSDQCVVVPTANIVTNCKYYSNQTTCGQCNTKFYLSNNTCTAYDVANCTTQTKQGICDACDLGYAFSDSTKTSCVSTSVTNCDTINQSTKLCSICTMGYYLKADGSCAMANLIPGCLKYDSLSTCTLCEKQLFLDQTRTRCLPNVPELQRCESTNATTQSLCSQCLPNYKLVDGKCIQPTGTSFDIAFNSIKGCLIQSQRNPILCEVCQSGFTMNSTQTCEGSTQEAPPVTPITPTNPNKPKSIAIFRALFSTLGMISILLLFQYYYYIYNYFL